MLIFFAATGAVQMFGLRLPVLAEIHTRGCGSLPFMILAFFMGLSVVVTSVLGVVMAFRFGDSRKNVWACLIFGALIPVLLLVIVHLKQ
jgi:hypothetical protein